jgi:hypothetical protein
MVAVIHSSSSLRNALNYNEQKVKEQVATCLAAVHYPKDLEYLNFYQKLNRLQNQAALNVRTKVNSVHISLNFDPSEKLSEERLKEIADTYLQKIGFAKQPYLLYQHNDSGHPHVHIVTTNIKADGKRIELHNLGKIQSEKARKEIEISFGLIKAEDSKQQHAWELKPVNVQKVQYGRSATKRAITNVLDAVLKTYKYTSLPELNAVLQQYNVIADRGTENSRVYKNNGLTYRILDEHGEKVGVPIKASDFYSKPTMKFLEERFPINEAARQSHKARVKNTIDLAFLKQPKQTLQVLVKTLENEGINTVVRQNADGIIYGLTYVDHRTKCVFNGSVIGKQYSAKGIIERCVEPHKTSVHEHEFVKQLSSKTLVTDEQMTVPANLQNKEGIDLLETLLQPEHTSGFVPYQLTKKGGKKRKKRINNRL